MRAKSALGAFVAGLAFVGTVMTVNPAYAGHTGDWNYPATPYAYRNEVICGANRVGHPYDYETTAGAKIRRAAFQCGGPLRSGPGPLTVWMTTTADAPNGYVTNCHANPRRTDFYYTGEQSISISTGFACPAWVGLIINQYTQYGGVIFDRTFGPSWPQLRRVAV